VWPQPMVLGAMPLVGVRTWSARATP